MSNAGEHFAARAAATPDAPAVQAPEGVLTYAELDRAVSWLARRLERGGCAEGDRVAIQTRDPLRHLVLSLALTRLGACQLALQAGDPPAVREDLARRLQLRMMLNKAPSLAEMKALDAAHFPPRAVDERLPFAIKRTSGTTGAQRLGVLTHAAARHQIENYPEPVAGAAVRFMPLIHVGLPGALALTLRALGAGGCVVLARAGGEPRTMAEFIDASGVNFLYGTAVHAHWLLKAAGEGAPRFPRLEAFAVGSTLIADNLRDAIRARLAAPLWIFYGINEVGMVSAAPPELVARAQGTVGFPLKGVDVRVVDEAGAALPAGRRGLLHARSAEMLQGYLDDPAATASAFRDGWFLSSDLVERTAEGALLHHGRADELIIYSGINIDPAAIESVLAAHPAVAAVAAFGVPSESAGQLPAAAVVLRSRVGPDELGAWCRERLGLRAPHHFLACKALPRSAAGKILKRELADRLVRRLAVA